MRILTLLVVSLFVLPAMPASRAAAAGDDALIPREVLFSDPDKFAVRISPDGSEVGYLAAFEGRTVIWKGRVASPFTPAPMREIDGSIGDFQWAYTGRHLLFTRQAGEAVHLFAWDLEEGKERDLTPDAKGRVRIEQLSPDLPKQLLVTRTDRGPRTLDLHRVDIVTGESRLVMENERFGSFLHDAQLRPRVAREDLPGGDYELSIADEKGAWRVLTRVPVDVSNFTRPVALDKEGRTLYLVDAREHDPAALVSIDLATGKERVLARDPDADIVPFVMVQPGTGKVQSATAYFGRARRHYLDRSIAADFERLGARPGEDVGIGGQSLDGNVWLVVRLDGGPNRYYAYDRKAGRTTFLFTDNAAVEGLRLADRHAVVVTARDGLRLPADLYLPPGAPAPGERRKGEPLPMLVYVHGGPSIAYPWNSWFTNRIFQVLVNRGYAVLRVEFRGAGGFGRRVLEAGNLEWGRKMQDDLFDAVDWAVKQKIADPKRVGIYGWSYGGYAALAGLAFTPDRFACGMALYPVSDLQGLIESSPERYRPVWRSRLGDDMTEQGRAFLASRSPLFHVERITKPLLLTHGVQDNIALPSHSERFVEAMRGAKKPVTYLRYPDEGHDYRDRRNWISLFAVAERFFHEHLGGRYEPIGDDLQGSSIQIVAGGDLVPGLAAAAKASGSGG